MGIDSTVGIATRYRLDGPGIESLVGGARFTASDQTAPGAHPASYTIGTAYFPGLKRPGRGIDHSPSSDEVKERVELYISAPPLWTFVACTRVNITFTFPSYDRCSAADEITGFLAVVEITNNYVERFTRLNVWAPSEPSKSEWHSPPATFKILVLTTRCIYVPEFGRVFLMLNYTENPHNTYIQSSMVKEILVREV